jgi:hypothetical protein
LRLPALDNLVSINVDVDRFGLTKNLKARVDADWLPNSQVEDGVVTIGHVFQVDESFSSEIWLVMVSINCDHAVLIETYHPFRKIRAIILRIISIVGIMIKEVLKLIVLFACAYPRINLIIF